MNTTQKLIHTRNLTAQDFQDAWKEVYSIMTAMSVREEFNTFLKHYALRESFDEFAVRLHDSVSFTETPTEGCEPGAMRALGLDFPELAAMSPADKRELAEMLIQSAEVSK